ncbi:hypothetical protein RIVERRIDER_13 [Xanthomonas phage RiverRider]|uniref:Uncharacterized protein n=1 Tax=Xanthomonas phage RiverRider TaxID=2108116 RepID=A0A2P1JUS0_9CAUD|nr:hypothetical protein HWB58_gp13 [Xanthomonas phage RiverRider]AVO23101.1 hypothetical protein RIVERRIDER_13 [Xanthomonas phage RiverRider]
MKYVLAFFAIVMIILIASFAPQLMQLAWGLLALLLIVLSILVLIGVVIILWVISRTLRG